MKQVTRVLADEFNFKNDELFRSKVFGNIAGGSTGIESRNEVMMKLRAFTGHRF